jgi:hypothetical protein
MKWIMPMKTLTPQGNPFLKKPGPCAFFFILKIFAPQAKAKEN